MQQESNSLGFLTEDDASAQLFRQARGAEQRVPINLSWLDVDKVFLLAVNERPGDDVGVALEVADGSQASSRVTGLSRVLFVTAGGADTLGTCGGF